MLAENRENATRNVSWAFADVVEGGWIERECKISSLGIGHTKFLVVTEGSSDAKIIKHTLNLLRPDIADFFYFIDMTWRKDIHLLVQEIYIFSVRGW